MKTIEDCLDEILRRLKKIYDESGKPTLDYSSLQDYFETKMRRPEFITGLIDMLIKDEYVIFFSKLSDTKENEEEKMKDYCAKALITPKGLYFINAGGYIEKEKNVKAKNCLTNLLNVVIALGTLFAGLYGLVELWKFVCP